VIGPAWLNRIKGLLAGYGMCMAWQGEVETQLEEVRQWDGAPLPAGLRNHYQCLAADA
jgi:hypothetical protein